MKVRFLTLPALAMLAMVLLNGCGGTANRDADRIGELYGYMESTIENEDISGVMSLYSSGFFENGYSKTDVRNNFLDFFDAYHSINENITVRSVHISGNYAEVEISEWWEATDASGVRRYVDPAIFVDIWRYENEDWYIYGNQQNAPGLKLSKPLRWSRARAATAKTR